MRKRHLNERTSLFVRGHLPRYLDGALICNQSPYHILSFSHIDSMYYFFQLHFFTLFQIFWIFVIWTWLVRHRQCEFLAWKMLMENGPSHVRFKFQLHKRFSIKHAWFSNWRPPIWWMISNSPIESKKVALHVNHLHTHTHTKLWLHGDRQSIHKIW